jgi:hypothetical protein
MRQKNNHKATVASAGDRNELAPPLNFQTAPGLMKPFLVLLYLSLAAPLYAQPGFPDDPAAVPVDGGLTLLAAAGAAYGVNRLRQRRKKGGS